MLQQTDLRTSPKKARKPQERSRYLRAAILNIADAYEHMSVRQLFYQLVARRFIEKTEQAYKRVCDATVQLRLSGELPYGKIVDGHRSRRAAYQHSGLRAALENAAGMYRRNYWLEQPEHVEIWCEKDALTGVIWPTCEEYGVPYVATRGFPSITLIHDTARELIASRKPATIFYFGDHDASGRSISSNLERDLRGHGAEVTVIRVGLNPDQIADYDLPTRPGKWSDSRHAKFAAEYGDACVELDALPPDVLTNLVASSIKSKIHPWHWSFAQMIEQSEREMFDTIAAAGWDIGKRHIITLVDEDDAEESEGVGDE